LELHLTYDEEAGGLCGPGYLLSQGISRPDYAISAGFSYNIVTAHNGCLHLEIDVLGRSAHAAMPASGADALEAAAGVLTILYEMRWDLAQRPSATPGIGPAGLTVGLISGGINTNVVPDRVTLRLDRRILPEEDLAEVETSLRRLIEETVGRYPHIAVRISRILLAEPLIPMAGQERLVGAIRRPAERIFGTPITTHGVPIYTDARLYSAAGVPTVLYGAGPRTFLEANGHRADEKLRLEDLFKATEVLALALIDLCRRVARR
jgi:acetylornithine deacetylase/succinyl-diaminopimelate desuccinylase-like protein